MKPKTKYITKKPGPVHFIMSLSYNYVWTDTTHQQLDRLGVIFKRFLLSTFIISNLFPTSTAQTVIGGLTPDSSALLDLQSTKRGLLLPRMTESQRDSIMKPAQGLQIFNLTSNCLEINLGLPSNPLWSDIKCLGSISTFDCGLVLLSQPIFAGYSVAGNTFSIPYTGGNGGEFNSQIIHSTGITGLVATLASGTFVDGNGTLTLNLSGMTYQVGLAQFSVTVGGQSCVVEVVVNTGYPEDYVHCDSINQTVVNDVINPMTGKIWMDRNLGALRVATSYNDAEAYGDLYQWGRFADGHQCRGSDTTSTNATTAVPNAENAWDGKFIVEKSLPGDWLFSKDDNLWQGLTSQNNPCPYGYKLPTSIEWEEERQSWIVNNINGAFSSPLKLPASGHRPYFFGAVGEAGINGKYWSSSVKGSVSIREGFASEWAGLDYYPRAWGLSVRCIKYY